MQQNVQLPAMQRAAEIRASSFNADENTVDIVWTTGAKVRRYDWREGQYYDEELVVTGNAVRLDRLNLGAPFLDTHSSWELRDVIGSVVPGTARIEGGKGYAKIMLSRAPGDADVVSKIRDGIIRNISVGYRYHKVEKTAGEDGDVGLWRVVDWEPLELSAVPIPADPGAQVRSQPKQGERGADLFECVVIRADADPSSPSPTASASAETTGAHSMSNRAATAAETSGTTEDRTAASAPVVTVDTEALRAEAVKAERKRADDITAIATKFNARDFADQHIQSGSSVEDFRAALIDHLAARQTEQQGNTGTTERGAVLTVTSSKEKDAGRGEAISTALLHRFDPVKYPMTGEAREFRGMSLLEIARDCLEANGVRTRGMSRNEVAQAALDAGQRAGAYHSTADFPFVLANVATKTLRAAYEQSPQTFRPFTRVTTMPDFKAVFRTQLGEAPIFERVNEHGEFKRGTMPEAREQYALATYGKVVAITRQVIINDDLNAFTRVPTAFGFQAANLESDLVWSQILGNPTMGDAIALFNAAHGNLGTAAAISIDSIALAREAMRIQRGLDGTTPLNLTPRYLITSVAAETKAQQLLFPITPALIGNAVPNYMSSLSHIAEPRLDNGVRDPVTGNTIAGSRFAWYMVAEPGMIDTIELAYLEGNQGVYTETRQGFDVDGVEVKVRLDAAAKVIDWRGFYRNPATAL